MKTLLSGGVIVTCDESHTVYAAGDLVIEDDRLVHVGGKFSGEYDERHDISGYLLMPGLVNAHTHSGMSIFRSLSDDVDLFVFLHERVWPREVQLTEDDVYAGSVLSAIEMLKAGVTTYVDMYFFENALLRAALDTGARAIITPTLLDVEPWTGLLGPWDKQLQRGIEFARKWNNAEGRIFAGLGPHAPYTVPLEVLREVGEEARRSDIPVNIHLVETQLERDEFNARGLGSTTAALDRLHFFDGPVIAAHSIWIDDGDLDIYHEHAVGVAHCPQSNSKLVAGVAPVVEMLARGVAVGLGTDGAATNNNHDLWEELRLAPLLAKMRAGDPKVLPAREALWLATRLGARAVHRPDIGVLATGFKADVLMLDLNDTTAVPIFSDSTYIDHLVYSFGSRQVDSVWVNGRQVVRHGEITSIDEVAARVAAQATALSLARRSEGVG